LRANVDHVPIRSWLAAKWKKHLAGYAFGDLHWAGQDPKLESSSGEGSLRVSNGRIDNLPVLEKLAELSQKKSFEHLALSDCSLRFWMEISQDRHREHCYRRERKIPDRWRNVIEQCRLRGTMRLGLTREYLDWLPNPEEVFSRKQDGIYGPMCICLERSMTPGKI
jgi:hypothetical protein